MAKEGSSKRRRRVSFADNDSSSPQKQTHYNDEDEIKPVNSDPADDDNTPLADITGGSGLPQHSLLAEDTSHDTITPFDIADELQEGARFDPSNDDGVIPTVLQSTVNTEADDAADFTSEDDDEPVPDTRPVRDAWADAMDNAGPPAHTLPDNAPAQRKRRKTGAAATSGAPVLSRASAVTGLVQLLRAAESPAQALTRLKRERRTRDLGIVTDLCHSLLGHGEFSAYDFTREELLHLVKWDLAWGRVPRADAKCHGPFDATMMGKWERGRYFSQKGKTAWVRPHAASHVTWLSARDIFAAESL